MNEQMFIRQFMATRDLDKKRLFPRFGKGTTRRSLKRYTHELMGVVGYCIDAPDRMPAGSVRKVHPPGNDEDFLLAESGFSR